MNDGVRRPHSVKHQGQGAKIVQTRAGPGVILPYVKVPHQCVVCRRGLHSDAEGETIGLAANHPRISRIVHVALERVQVNAVEAETERALLPQRGAER